MFQKRIKKTFPPGTFVEAPLRLMAILQLCLIFTLVIWNISLPFMGDRFTLQKKLHLVDHLMHDKERFSLIPDTSKEKILQFRQTLEEEIDTPLSKKLNASLWQLLIKIPPFELAWLLFGCILSIMVLKKREGARAATWILPLLALAHAYDSLAFGTLPLPTQEARLYPEESYLIHRYLKEPLSTTILTQQHQLKEAWKHYIVQEWAGDSPADFDTLIQEGEYRFFTARALAMANEKRVSRYEKPSTPKEPPLLLSLYLLWNTAFASIATKKRTKDVIQT